MKIKKVKLYRYRLPLRRELQLAGNLLKNRDGLILEITDSEGHHGFGEIAPLPGFSKEHINDCIKSIKGIRTTLTAVTETSDFIGSDHDLAPSVQFGVEAGILSLCAARTAAPLAKIITTDAPDSVPVNALLSGSGEQILSDMKRLLAEGYSAFKLKVGRQPPEDEIRLISEMRQLISEEEVLILDANRAFDLDAGIEFIKAVNDLGIEYIEEPFVNIGVLREYMDVADEGRIIGLDETTREISVAEIDAFIDPAVVNAFVLKPTLLGYAGAMDWASHAGSYGIMPVISSSFESSIGIYTLASMACIINESAYCGLDTLSWLGEDTVKKPLVFKGGRLDLKSNSSVFDSVRYEIMTEIDLDE